MIFLRFHYEFTKSLGLEVKEIILTNYENEMEEEDGDFFDDQIQMQTFKTKHIIVTVHEDDPYQYTENYKTLIYSFENENINITCNLIHG